MKVVLIPGFWLDASSWAPVTSTLQAAGHTPFPVTPRGAGGHTGRRDITLADQVEAVTSLVDTLDEPVVLVGHSGGGAVAHGIVDARPDRVARAVYVDSGPLADGGVIDPDLPAVDGEVPLPDWSFFEDDTLRDMSERVRAEFRARAIPVPEPVAHGPLRLHDERRYRVPVTVISTTMPEALIRELLEQAHPYFAELAATQEVEILELPTGHWPQLTRPDELAALIVGVVERAADRGFGDGPSEESAMVESGAVLPPLVTSQVAPR